MPRKPKRAANAPIESLDDAAEPKRVLTTNARHNHDHDEHDADAEPSGLNSQTVLSNVASVDRQVHSNDHTASSIELKPHVNDVREGDFLKLFWANICE